MPAPYTLERLRCLKPGEKMNVYVAKEDLPKDIKNDSGAYQDLLTDIYLTMISMESKGQIRLNKIPRTRSKHGLGEWIEYTYEVERL